MEEKTKYIKFVTRPSSVARDEGFIRFLLQGGLKSFITVPINLDKADYFVEKESYLNLLKSTLDDTLKKWKQHLEEYQQIKNDLVSASKEVKVAIKERKSHPELIDAYLKYTKICIKFGPYIFLPFSLKEYVEQKIMRELPDKFEMITSLDRPTEFHKFQKALLNEPAEKIKEKFGWLNVYSLLEEPYTLEEINELKKTVNKEEVEKIFLSFEENKRKFEEFISTVEDSEKIAILNLMHEHTFLRTDRVDAWKEGLCNLIPFFNYLSKLISPNCELKHVIELSSKEIHDLLDEIKIPSMEELEKRAEKKGIFYYAPDEFRFISNGEEKDKILERIEKINVEENEIKGMIACQGTVKGKVKIIKTEADLRNFEKGQILVAVATEPRYTLYMEKAAAIVTDEGGITCHAAIVAREMNKPCIIGTEIATKVLKDGDLVEVDADNGIVRKIENKQ